MKTAIIRTYEIHGTRGQIVSDVMYRGRVLKSFYQRDLEPWQPSSDVARYAREWATCNGFTHYKKA